jgi:hypothetical protein
MAKAVIIDSKVALTGSVKSTEYQIASATAIKHNAKATSISNFTQIKEAVDFPLSKITSIPIYVTAEDILPFRVKFTNIGIEGGYGPSNPAPIGIAVIGTNNYIL